MYNFYQNVQQLQIDGEKLMHEKQNLWKKGYVISCSSDPKMHQIVLLFAQSPFSLLNFFEKQKQKTQTKKQQWKNKTKLKKPKNKTVWCS